MFLSYQLSKGHWPPLPIKCLIHTNPPAVFLLSPNSAFASKNPLDCADFSVNIQATLKIAFTICLGGFETRPYLVRASHKLPSQQPTSPIGAHFHSSAGVAGGMIVYPIKSSPKLGELFKINDRAPAFDPFSQALPWQLAQARLPRGTRKNLLTAASFRT